MSRSIALLIAASLVLSPRLTWSAERIDFARNVQPILQAKCLKCHGGVKRRGGLSLLQRADALAETESGLPAIVPGRPDESELIRRITSHDDAERMPADGEVLSKSEIERLRAWIAQGAPWEAHWSLQPVRRIAPPGVRDERWVRNPIDRFILARLEDASLTPAPEAEPYTLIRRLHLDLLGLPPTMEEVDAFVADDSPEAYERLVERLLSSPHFGERWGRHWLDLARYADTDGYEVDGPRPNAWYWRDWVIRAINDDLPFDRFTVEQLAGDLLPDATLDQKLATAFHRQTLTNNEGGVDKEEFRVEAVFDRVSTTATVWMGLTMGCAQCHDHPYDPLRQREFYQLFAFFNNADESQLRLPTAHEAEYQQKKAAHARRLDELQAQLQTAPEAERAELEKRLKQLEKQAPRDPAVRLDVMAQREQPRTTYVFHRGNFLQPIEAETVLPAGLAVLPPLTSREPNQSPDRLDLARWLVDPAHPLTPRVTVNYIWQHLFGQGLVRTPDDFGATGEFPTHPELLDWLASEFLRLGWSRKQLMRLIVTSATYRQDSGIRFPEAHGSRSMSLPSHRQSIDPENRLLARQNRFRVEGEIVRDLHLAASGLLARKIGGPSVFPPFPQDLTKIDFRSDLKWETSAGPDRYRRGMYTFFKRTLPHPNLTTFDCPLADSTTVRRAISNTPLQALTTLNNEVFIEAARAFAQRVLVTPGDDAERVTIAFRTCLSRPPSDWERSRLLELLAEYRQWYTAHPEQAGLLTGLDPMGQSDRRASGQLARAATEPASATSSQHEATSEPGKLGCLPYDPVEAAAWTGTAGVLLNLDEFITRE